MKKAIVFILVSMLLVSCSQAAPTPDPALFAAKTEIASAQTEISQIQMQLGEKDATLVYVLGQYHWLQSATPVTVTRVVAPTFTPTPKYTPTITNTPEPTNTPSPTVDPLKKPKGDGSYMVGSEISPGIWRSEGGSPDEDCALKISTYSGDLVDITYTLPGATIRIPEGNYMVYIGGGSGNRCTWTYMMP